MKIDAICHTTNDTYTDDESVYNKKVYDIEVEDNHNFVICGSTTTNGVVVHNCHHIAAEVFSRALPKINAYYSIGLSATPKRSDGLSKIFHMYLGPFIFRMEKRDDVKKIEIHAMHYYDTDESYSQEEYTVTQKLCLPKMINNIANHPRRNDMIEALVRRLVNLNEVEPRKIIILSDRREHLAELYRRCSKFATVGYYIGGMKQKDLNESEKKQVIFGTYPMSSEGLDIGDLNTCIFTTPKSSIEQSVGRIVRKNHAIPPLAFDIVDHFSMFPGQYKKRETVYRKLDYDIYDHTIRTDESTSMSNLMYQVDQSGVLREPKKRGRKATSSSSASSCQSSMKKEKDIFDLCFNTKDGDEDEDDESDEEENQNVDTMFRDD
jgi:superfamily II DNA or RNA helicase